MLLDRLKRLNSIAINFPDDVKSVAIIFDRKTEAVEAALKREAAALENAITPEAEAELAKLEDVLAHIPGLSELVKAHAAEPAPGAETPAASDAAPVKTAVV